MNLGCDIGIVPGLISVPVWIHDINNWLIFNNSNASNVPFAMIVNIICRFHRFPKKEKQKKTKVTFILIYRGYMRYLLTFQAFYLLLSGCILVQTD